MERDFIRMLHEAHQKCPACPSSTEVASFFETLLGTMFPDFKRISIASDKDFEDHFSSLKRDLSQILSVGNRQGAAVADGFFKNLPELFSRVNEDVTAMFEGDPAAKSRSEVIRSYPGFYAIAAYRIAHALNLAGVQQIPRMITELAHSKTGIDIHPGAKIGRHFCIDHGTGIVIGETTVIGDHVKLYQGVTLGALSVSKEDAARKRHPTIEDNVVVYAGATILGGETKIGHDSIVGGNVWITRSVPPYSKIYYQAKMYNGEKEETDVVIFRSDKE
jgi:serine O-acetyltransferase